MFNAFLSSQVFAVPQDLAIDPHELASWWSGQTLPRKSHDRICWEDKARVATEACLPWYTTPPPATIPVQNGLVLLSQESNAQFFAFISPLTGVSSAFKLSASMHLKERSNDTRSSIETVSVDLTSFVNQRWDHLSGMLTSIEGYSVDGHYVVTTLRNSNREKPSFFYHLNTISRIALDVGGHKTKIDDGLKIEIDDVSKSFDSIASSLQETFSIVKSYCHTNASPNLTLG